MNMNAVGIDVSKGKAWLLSFVLMVRSFQNHLKSNTQSVGFALSLSRSNPLMANSYCHGTHRSLLRTSCPWTFESWPFVSAINPKLIKDFGDNSLRKVKSDKADAVKIARYTLDSWTELRQYSLMDEIRNQLKTMNRQFDFYMKHKTAMKNNLISILDQTYPGANTYFDSPAREDGSQKWVDFSATYWHVDCVRKLSKRLYRPLSKVV